MLAPLFSWLKILDWMSCAGCASFYHFSLCCCSGRCRFSMSRFCNIIRLGTWKALCWSFSTMKNDAWNWGIWRRINSISHYYFYGASFVHGDWIKIFVANIWILDVRTCMLLPSILKWLSAPFIYYLLFYVHIHTTYCISNVPKMWVWWSTEACASSSSTVETT